MAKADLALAADQSILVAVCGPAPTLRVYFHRLTVLHGTTGAHLQRESLPPYQMVPGALRASMSDLPSITAIAIDPVEVRRGVPTIVVAAGTLNETTPCLLERWRCDHNTPVPLTPSCSSATPPPPNPVVFPRWAAG